MTLAVQAVFAIDEWNNDINTSPTGESDLWKSMIYVEWRDREAELEEIRVQFVFDIVYIISDFTM